MDHKRCLAILQSNMDEEITKAFHPLLYLIQRIKMPLRISQPGRLPRVLGSLGFQGCWAPEVTGLQSSIGSIGSRLIGLPGLPLVPPAIWSPWAPNTINICWAPKISWASIASKQEF